jgi:anthranilate phosphoribosyltransferase
VLELLDGEARSWTVEPVRLGVAPATELDLAGAEPAENARIVEQVLAGRGSRGAADAVTLNAAGALYVAGKAPDFASALTLARDALRAGVGREALAKLRTASRKAAATK